MFPQRKIEIISLSDLISIEYNSIWFIKSSYQQVRKLFASVTNEKPGKENFNYFNVVDVLLSKWKI